VDADAAWVCFFWRRCTSIYVFPHVFMSLLFENKFTDTATSRRKIKHVRVLILLLALFLHVFFCLKH